MGRPRTPDEIRRIRKGVEAYWASLSSREYAERCKGASNRGRTFTADDRLEQAEMMRGVWASRSSGEVAEIGKHISEGGAGRKPYTAEELVAHSQKALNWWASLSSEERTKVRERMTEANRRSYASGMHKSPREAMLRHWGSKTEEEKHQHYLNSFGSPEAIKKSGENWRKYYWNNLSDVEKAEYFRLRSCARRQTIPEQDMEIWLDERQPNEWKYNGDCREGIVIGGKTPDFVNVNGLKAVVEVFSSYYHDTFLFPDKETPEELIAHYAKYGFKCHVFWDYEVYDEDLLKERLS